MFMTEVKFDEAIENAFKRGIAFQKANQRELENAWFDIGYNAACKEHGIDGFKIDAERYKKLKSFMLPEVKVKTIWQGSLSDWTPDKDHFYVTYSTWEILEKSLDKAILKDKER
jgi:hypothetical protein